MIFKKLAAFIEKEMRMSHLYQPAMIKALLQNGGRCSQQEIARALLAHDQSQVEYYSAITNNMVGRVLRNRGVVTRNATTKDYVLDGYESLTAAERKELVALCERRLAKFVEVRGKRLFAHRRISAGYVPGTVRYEVLKRARFRCELCGISAEEKALEVDHIIPRNKKGTDDINNFQALCYSCNATKRDRDDVDFRAIADSYRHREKGCLFCEIPSSRIIAQNELAYAIRDGFPVTELHTLVIPRRHVPTYFDLGQAEINAVQQLLKSTKLAG